MAALVAAPHLAPAAPGGGPTAGRAAGAAGAKDVEPMFNYSRCVPKLASLLPAGAVVTCAAVHTRFLVRGVVYYEESSDTHTHGAPALLSHLL